MLGRTLGHYQVLGRLGAGGMGEVYRGRDQRLERDVAIKVLPAEVFGDVEARNRLRREALALSKLNHPHVATVFDFDSQGGVDFIVMELLEGETLAARIARGPLSESEAVRWTLQAADALEAAHRSGVIHRDLKPGNLFITTRGDLKVLDFGLAKRMPRATEGAGRDTITMLTQPQQVVGTLAYMPPEQLRGDAVDERADLYALGAVLYEMLTGHAPFEQDSSMALAGMILNSPPVPPGQLRRGLSPALGRAVLTCLQKDPGKRFVSASALIAALRPAGRAGEGLAWRNWLKPAAFAVVALAVALFVLFRPRLFPAPMRSVAVLPMENLSRDPDQEFFAEGLTEELISLLGNIGALRVISRESAMTYRGTNKRLPEIARELKVEDLILGSVQRSMDHVRIRVRLVKASDERQLWSQSFDSGLGDVLTLQSKIAEAVTGELKTLVTRGERTRLRAAKPASAAAHDAYLRGRYYLSTHADADWKVALEKFQEAIRLDPEYALAYAGLSDTYWALSNTAMPPLEAMPRARAAAAKALDLDPDLAEGHVALAHVKAFYDWQWADAERELRRAIELKPSLAAAHQAYGYVLTVNKRYEEANRELRTAWELDPLSSFIAFMQLWPINRQRKDDAVIEKARALVNADATDFGPHLIMAQALLRKREYEPALREFRETYRLFPIPAMRAWLGYGFAVAGRRDSAEVIRRDLEAASASPNVEGYTMAVMYTGLGDRERAIQWLRKGVEQRSEEMVQIQSDDSLDPLRSDPRFAAIVRQVGFTP